MGGSILLSVVVLLVFQRLLLHWLDARRTAG
jgi:hypothetical protein